MDTGNADLKAIVCIKKEDEWFVATCPLLDVASQGRTEAEALMNIEEAVRLFLETCSEMGTLDQVMHEAGIGNFQPLPAPDPVYQINHFVNIIIPRNQRNQCVQAFAH
ncbi:MAG: type II toxin-antitoxin system HicB family antitoxin [Magnetococcales bacterium]|nr:type II toxin-antitoxin system HicB family antitoxin [Magnetococcales bacterium]